MIETYLVTRQNIIIRAIAKAKNKAIDDPMSIIRDRKANNLY